MAKKTKSSYDPWKVEKDYRRYGHKDAFSGNQLSKQHKYRMAKVSAERKAKRRTIEKQRKKPQTKRGFVSATLDTLTSPLSAVATPVYNKLKGKKTNVFKDIYRGFTAGLPGSGRANEMRTFSDVFDAGQDFMHRHGRTTRTDEMLVRMGKATYAPRPTVGNSSNKYGVPVVGADGTYEGVRNTGAYQTIRGGTGFALDVALDPLNFVSAPAGIVGKFVKGSGASLSRLKQIGKGLEGVERVAKSTDESGHVVRTVIKPGESVDDVLEGFDNAASTVQVKKTKDVVKHLYTERDARKRTELLSGVSEDGVYQRLRKNQAYEIYDNDALKTIARDTSDTFRSTYLHIPTPKEEIDIAIGLKNKPFSHMRSLYLNKKVAMDQTIRKAGDLSGVAPMYNELAQKLRTSRIGRTFSNINKTEADIRHNYDAIENYATLYAVKGKQGLADANIDILTKADKFIEQWNSLSPEQQLRVRSAIENGDLKRANSFFTFQEKTGNKLDNVDVDKTVQGIQDQVKFFQTDKRHAENVLRVLEEQGQRKFTPAQYMFYRVNGKMPDLSTKDKDVIDIYNLMLLDSKYQDLDVSKTFLNAYNNVMDMHAESVMGRLDTNVRKGISTFTKGSNFTALGLARSQLENGTADVATAFDNFIRTVGAEDAYYFLRDNAVFADGLKTKLAHLDNFPQSTSQYNFSQAMSQIVGASNEFAPTSVLNDIYVNPVTSHALDMLKMRGANDGDFLATAFNAVKDTFIKATVAGDTSVDGLKEAGNIVSIVDDKLAEASRSGKQFTLNDVLLNLKDDTRKGIVDAYIDTAQGHRDLVGRVSGNSLFDKYKSWRQADEKALREARNTVAYSEKQSTFRDLLSPADNEFLDSIGMMESIINPTFKANSFSQSLEDVGDAIDKLRFYEEQYDKFRKSAEAFEGGTQGTMYDLVRGFTNEMNRIGVEEVRAGELATEQFKKYKDVYFPHIMTDEAKKINNARGLEFESNGAFSDVFSRGGNYASHRISGLTVDEMNASKGYEYFKTNLVDVYLERALQSNRLIYADSSTKFLFDKFSKEVAPLVEGATKLSSGVDQNHTLAIPFNALDRIINKTAGRSISKAAYQYAKNAAKTFEANYSSRQAVETIRADIREVRAALKEHTDFINEYKPLFDDKAYPRYNEYLNARHAYDEAREAEKLGYGSHELTEARGELFQKYADDKESFFLQQDKEHYPLYNKAIKEVEDMRDTLKGLFDDLKRSRLEYNKNLNLMKQNGYTNLAGDMTHDEIVEAYKNIWMREHGNEMFRERKNSVVDSIFGKADDKDRKIAMRRQCYATNIPVQTLTDEQAEAIRALYNKPEDFYKDICQFDNDVLDKVNIMSRSQELAGTHAILKAYDNFILQYKRLNTLVDPSFHVQNGLSNAFQSFMGTSAAAFNPSKLNRAYRILKANPDYATKIVELGGKEYTYRQLYEYMKQFGVVDESFTRFEMLGGNTDRVINNIRQSPAVKNVFKDVVYPTNIGEDATKFEKAMSYNPMSWYMQWSGNIGTNIETTQRANLFINALDEGQSLSDAVRTVNKYMFDYSDLTKFEKDWLKRAIPFYTFMRKNIPIELETLLTKPKKFSGIAYLEQELNNEQEDSIPPNWRNQWRQNYFQIPGLGDGQWGIDPKLPYEQLDRLDPQLMENGWEPKTLGRLLGSTNPLLKAAIELPTGTNQYVDMPLDEGKDGMDFGDYLKYAAGMTIPSKIISESIGYQNEGDGDKRFNKQVKDITSHLAFPIGHIYDMAEFKNMIEATNYNTGEKFNYASYMTQDEVEDLYKNTYLKWAQEEHDRKELYYSRAFDKYKYTKDYRDKGRPSFDEVLEQWHVKTSYEEYVEYCKQNGYNQRSKKDWKKYNNYKYVEE